MIIVDLDQKICINEQLTNFLALEEYCKEDFFDRQDKREYNANLGNIS